jgi:hypothetical protein
MAKANNNHYQRLIGTICKGGVGATFVPVIIVMTYLAMILQKQRAERGAIYYFMG